MECYQTVTCDSLVISANLKIKKITIHNNDQIIRLSFFFGALFITMKNGEGGIRTHE